MAGTGGGQLQQLVGQADGDVLVLHDDATAGTVATLEAPRLVRSAGPAQLPSPQRWALVLVAVADAASLRRLMPTLPRCGGTRVLGCWVAESETPLTLAPRPEWPPLAALNARRLPTGGCLTVLRFGRPVQVHLPLQELAQVAVPGGPRGHRGLVVATTDPDAPTAPPADHGLQVLTGDERYAAPDAHLPPDVVLGSPAPGLLPVEPVTGRPPAVVTDPVLLGGPLDEGVLNPRGFLERTTRGVVELTGSEGFGLRGDGLGLKLDPRRGATAAVVAALREHRGVRVSWPVAPAPHVDRVVAGLAMAGVPVVGDPPAHARAALGDRLADLIGGDVDLHVPLRRHEHSVRLRRTALHEHSSLGWRRRVAAAAGRPFRAFPSCSVLLVTRRPERLPFALRQVARQRADLELVVAGHGFAPDAELVREHVPDAVVLAAPSTDLFGDVLAAAASAASGDVLVKMDDDDWYARDFVGDLLWARHYSGAELVGSTAEYVYLEQVDRTVRRNDDSERVARFVAGGTMMVDRVTLAELGGFRPVTRSVDLQLLSAAQAAGATIYRTHGLGYVLRRSGSGHTWDADASYFLDPERLDEVWDGFRPSALLEADPVDVPEGAR